MNTNASYLLESMATVCPKSAGYGFILVVFSNDHNPPHFHVLLNSPEKTLCRYVITDKAPQSIKDLVLMKGDSNVLSSALKNNIVEWANTTKKFKLFESTGWEVAKLFWENENETSDFP